MADLTPPSSQNTTPLPPLHSNTDFPSSPTVKSAAHPLAAPTGNTMDVDAATASDSDIPEADEAMLSDDEDEEFVEAEESLPADGAVDKEGEGMEGLERSSGKAKKAKRNRGKARQQPPRVSGKAEGLGLKGKGRKDGDLYESEIVARWNNEIGDVCLDPPASAPSIAAT